MKKCNFNSIEAGGIYLEYMKNAKNVLSLLEENDIVDILNEIDSHIFEALNDNKNEHYSEKDKIELVLHNLGDPKVFLKPIIAERQLRRSINNYNIVGILKNIFFIILACSQYMFVLVMYLLILGGGIVAIIKIFLPNQTGLFMEDEVFVGFGYLSEIKSNSVELLGYWLIPITICLIVIFYFFTTFILKKTLKTKKKIKLWKNS